MDSRSKWNSKYKERLDQLKGPAANPRLKKLSSYLNGGIALDLACGLGGNSVFLARLNYQVQAMDISDVAISYLREKAVKDQLNIQPLVSDLTDLNSLHWRENSFDLVVITYYLDRALFPLVKSLIKDDGYFFMETFYQSPLIENHGVSSQYKLRPNELFTEFGNWKVLFFEEKAEEGRQTIFCQKRLS